MSDYVLTCCSTADMNAAFFEKRNIYCVPFHYYLDDVEGLDDGFQSISVEDFYGALKEGKSTRTSQVNIEEFVTFFTPFLAQGKDVVHVSFSSGLSGVFNSAATARDLLQAEFPERHIIIVDSLAASSGYGLLMDKLADLRDKGMGMTELAAWAETNKSRVNHWFTTTDLTYYINGGRISKASGWFGTVLKICPVLNMDEKGHLVPRLKVRGKKAALKTLVDKMSELADNGAEYADSVFISSSYCTDDALYVASEIETRFPHTAGHVRRFDIGTTIGSHTGPETVALFFWGSPRE